MTAICYNKKQEERLFWHAEGCIPLMTLALFSPIVAIQITCNSSEFRSILNVFFNTKINPYLWTFTIFQCTSFFVSITAIFNFGFIVNILKVIMNILKQKCF